jgi:hypothetical protein
MKVSKNARVLYSWRLPIMHALVLFCLYQQAQSLDKKYSKREADDVPSYVKAI